MSGQRAQVAAPETTFVPRTVAVSSTDTYIKPSPLTKEQVFSPLGEFLANLSPTLAEYGQKAAKVNEELKTQAILEQMAPKSVKDIDAMFKDPESFNKYADEFNSLTLAGQQNMGKILGVKYAEEAKLALQSKAIEENWNQLSPQEYSDKIKAGTKVLLDERKSSNPNAFTIPNFTSAFSTAMEEHNNAMISQQIPAFGEFQKETVMEQISTLAYDAVNTKGDFQDAANSVAKVINEQYPTFKSLDINKAIIKGVTASRNVPFLQSLLDGQALIKYGPNGETLNNTYAFKSAVSQAIRTIKTDDMDLVQKATSKYSQMITFAAQMANENLYRGKPLPTTEQVAERLKQFGLDVDPTELTAIVISTNRKSGEDFRNNHPVPQTVIISSAEKLATIYAEFGETSQEASSMYARLTSSMPDAQRAEVFAKALNYQHIEGSLSGEALKLENRTILGGTASLSGKTVETMEAARKRFSADSMQFLRDINRGNLSNPYALVLPESDRKQLSEIHKRSTGIGRSDVDISALATLWGKAAKIVIKLEDEEKRKRANDPTYMKVTVPSIAPSSAMMGGNPSVNLSSYFKNSAVPPYDPTQAGTVTMKQVQQSKKFL